jgi:hypothetical protein
MARPIAQNEHARIALRFERPAAAPVQLLIIHPRHCTPVRLSRGGCSFQFGRASARVHTMRGPNVGTATSSAQRSALNTAWCWQFQHDTSSDRTPNSRMLPSIIGSIGRPKRAISAFLAQHPRRRDHPETIKTKERRVLFPPSKKIRVALPPGFYDDVSLGTKIFSDP